MQLSRLHSGLSRLALVLSLWLLPCLASAQSLDASVNEQFQALREAVTQRQWRRVADQLPSLRHHYALTKNQRQYLALAEGLFWQSSGEHRRAIPLYEAVEPSSPYYPEARTNLAIAFLKQDWWSDAHRELKQLLALSAPDDEMKNRWRMMLGMSQLQQGFYRDARETFGRIDQGSLHSAFAWRGIGLAALHLGDHGGALNAFHRLKTEYADEVPEGAFLVAFTYDRMERLKLAEANYQEALLHYQHQLQQTRTALRESASGAAEVAALEAQQQRLNTLVSQSQYGLATIYDRR